VGGVTIGVDVRISDRGRRVLGANSKSQFFDSGLSGCA